MSVPQKISKLRNFIARNPALADVGFTVIGNQAVTPRTALSMLERGQNINAVILGLKKIGVDPPEQDWALAEDYYRSLLQLPGPHPKIYIIGTEMTLEQALAHLKRRDAAGQQLLNSYQGLTREMARRMK